MPIRNKIAKSFPMWSKGSIIIKQLSKYKIPISQNRQSFSMLSIFKMLSIFSGSRGPDGPNLPSPFGRKFQLSVQQRSLHVLFQFFLTSGSRSLVHRPGSAFVLFRQRLLFSALFVFPFAFVFMFCKKYIKDQPQY